MLLSQKSEDLVQPPRESDKAFNIKQLRLRPSQEPKVGTLFGGSCGGVPRYYCPLAAGYCHIPPHQRRTLSHLY